MTRNSFDPALETRNELFAAVPAESPGVIAINLKRLAANWRALSEFVAPAKCAAVVKADAYGLGADRVIPALASAGCTAMFVATLAEARHARKLTSPGIEIFVLDGIIPGAASLYADNNVWPVLSSFDEAQEWAAEAATRGAPLPCALHLDTGLNRLGMSPSEIHALADDDHVIGGLDVRLIMSHLACADELSHPKNHEQRNTLLELRSLLPSAPVSLAASDGIMLGQDFHFELVRPGYALYGGQATKGRPAPVKPVVEVYARVLQLREVARGQTVGYSATYAADKPISIAVIASGYADGYFRHLSAATGTCSGYVAFGGRLAPIVGRVSMDLITADVTALNGPPVARGDWAEIIGPTITLEDMGAAAGTIGYEALTRLGRRFHRIYLSGSGDG